MIGLNPFTIRVVIACCTLAAFSAPVRAQPATQSARPASEELVDLNFPDDGIDLTLLADIVTRRLHIPILYDEQLRGKKVIIRSARKVPESTLLGILQSALRMKQMALVDAEQPGWKQIVSAANLAAVAKSGKAEGADSPVAQVFVTEHVDPTKLAELIRPFLSQPGGSVQAVGQKVLMVADYPGVVRRVAAIIQDLDASSPKVETLFVQLDHATAIHVTSAATALINYREAFLWGNSNGSGVSLSPLEQANQIAVIAPSSRMEEVVGLIKELDKSQQLITHVYRLRSVSPDRVDQLIHSLVDPELLKRGYQSDVDRDSQTLVVAATPAIHEQIAGLLRDLDVPAPQSANPIQFYKLKNTKAADIISTISELLGEGATGQSSAASPSNSVPGNQAGGTPNAAFSDNSKTLGQSSAAANASASASPGPAAGLPTGGLSSGLSSTGTPPNSDLQNISPVLQAAGSTSAGTPPGALAVQAKGVTIAADVNTNSIIVVGPPPVQKMYADLIHKLDERRPQVQIECTIVTLDTTNNVTLGVDIGHLGGSGSNQLLTLSSFGVSIANPVTGGLTPTAGTGGTFALLSPQIADVVIRALETDSNARLVSAPRLLVNDNGTGKLQSVAQEPYAVILDASSTQSLTSLGGLAQAGTSITVEPHISEANYLQLTYSIELSNFTGAASNGLPPPSQKNSVDSSVTIPDGYSIVVGGLTTKNYSTAVNTIPFLGNIPLLKYLFGTHSKNIEDSTLFVFIRPVILRDDQFEDLRYLSSVQLQAAGLPADFPSSLPIAMH